MCDEQFGLWCAEPAFMPDQEPNCRRLAALPLEGLNANMRRSHRQNPMEVYCTAKATATLLLWIRKFSSCPHNLHARGAPSGQIKTMIRCVHHDASSS
jgi:hypothetical protein